MPFILILRKCWEEYVVKEVKDAGDEETVNPLLNSVLQLDIVNWVHWC